MSPNQGQTQRQAVVGVFEDQSLANQAVSQLKAIGFKDDQIGFAVRGSENTTNEESASDQSGDPAGGAVTGAVSGGILGGIVGAAASLLIPGIGPIIAGGILAATLGGAAIGAAAGGLLGALTEMGVSEEEADYYQEEFEAGRTIVTVQAGNRQEEALDILRRNGAYDADMRAAEASNYGDNYGTTQTNTERTTQMETSNMGQNQRNQQNQWATDESRAIPIREEQLRATTQPVETGEVRLTKDVITEEKTISVPVQREQVYVEQRNVAPRPAEGTIDDQGDMIRVPIIEEQVRIEKQPVVTGEVTIRKEQVQDTRQFSDTVRREEARIEREGDVDVQGNTIQGNSGMQPYQSNQPD